MDERPAGVSARAPEEPPRQTRKEYRRRRRAHAIPIVLGILLGAAAIAVAVILVRSGGGDAPAATTPATTAALPTLKILFPEGFTRREMATRIAAVNRIAKKKRHLETSLVPEEYLVETRSSPIPAQFEAPRKRTTLEGFLFPATYEFTPKTTARRLVELQLLAFRRAWSSVDLSYAKKRNLTPYDVLIIASMIEGEVRLPRERALVAAVIYNRLKAGMRLQIDATLRYGLHIPPTKSITESELQSPSPYNTYLRWGLPPTPIGNPGLASMKAAAKPASVDYVYYARKKDCKSHFFTASYARFRDFLSGPRC